MAKYRKKPVIIEAVQLPARGDYDMDEFQNWATDNGFTNFESDRDEGIVVHTLEGEMKGEPGDWIIKGIKGEFYPCKPDIFEATYERVT